MYKFSQFLVSILVVSSFFFRGSSSSVLAVDIPSFPSCANPSGSVKVSYPSGTHGIVGGSSLSGSDTVYTLDNGNNLQCFCAIDGAGIQTNWLKASNFSQAEINTLKSQGWVFIPNGKLWGLDEGPYLAINSNYACKGSTNGTSSNNNSSNNSNSSSGSSNGSGSVLGASVGSVLGLASTGNSTFLFFTALTGMISTILGLSLKKINSK